MTITDDENLLDICEGCGANRDGCSIKRYLSGRPCCISCQHRKEAS